MRDENDFLKRKQMEGSACGTEADLRRYVRAAVHDVHSIRLGLADAVDAAHYPGARADDPSLYPADRTERALFDDSMGSERGKNLTAETAEALRHALRLLESAATALRMMSALADRTAATELGRAPDQPKPWCGKCEDSRFGYHLDMGHTSAEGDFAAPCAECHPDPGIGTQVLVVLKDAAGQTRLSTYRGGPMLSNGL
ncbi:hypothetical protein OIE71_32815 [Streptomyces sp. NBC_01725]|uniref:hypothetical protein n=1 Tax=Streptomyces sp. NBC_01725 TaxID=2975923 RepID=UPI002E2C9C88|nr:hypothetical protein [Streptomyces sp. NBC_01725]